MCARFSLYANHKTVIKLFQLSQIKHTLAPSYNIAPSQQIQVVIEGDEPASRALTTMRWGLIPAWQQPDKPIRMNHCARSETADVKPTFKSAFKRSRCLILANGFYEWHETTKQPYYITHRNQEIFAMAGLWETWRTKASEILSCCILTQNPNPAFGVYHDRMPVILPPAHFDDWLSKNSHDTNALKELLMPLTENQLIVTPISKFVNSWKNDSSECIQPVT